MQLSRTRYIVRDDFRNVAALACGGTRRVSEKDLGLGVPMMRAIDKGLTNDLSDGDRRRLALLCVTNAVATMQMSYEGVLLAFNDAKTKLLTPTKVL